MKEREILPTVTRLHKNTFVTRLRMNVSASMTGCGLQGMRNLLGTLLCHWIEILPLSTTRSLFRAYQLHRRKNSVLAPSGTLEAQFDLVWIQFQVSHDTAQRIAMHTQLSRCLALIAFIVPKDFLNIAAAKLANSLFIRNTAGVHLYDQIIQFAFHSDLTCVQ